MWFSWLQLQWICWLRILDSVVWLVSDIQPSDTACQGVMLCGWAIIRGSGFFKKGKGFPPCYEGSGRNGSEPATTVAHWPVSSAEAGIGHRRKSRPEERPLIDAWSSGKRVTSSHLLRQAVIFPSCVDGDPDQDPDGCLGLYFVTIFDPCEATHCQRPAILIQVSVHAYLPLLSLPLYVPFTRLMPVAIAASPYT